MLEHDTPRQDQADTDGAREFSTSRRALLRGAAGTLPVILTLQSGAALARSSNLIVTATSGSAQDAAGRTMCLDTNSVYSAAEAGVYDMGDPPFARVTAINRRRWYRFNYRKGFEQVSEKEMCRSGTFFYRRRWGWRRENVRKGMLVSATALSSFVGKIDITDC